MPIVINGSGTVTGISVGGIPDGVVDTDVLAANAVTTAKLGSDEVSGLAKAWVNFNGQGAVAIRASFNVSSITDNGTGDYTVNFTTAMADTNYSMAASSQYTNASTSGRGSCISPYSSTTSSYLTTSLRVQACAIDSSLGSLFDPPFVNVAIFR
jgi:hypothetical protein